LDSDRLVMNTLPGFADTLDEEYLAKWEAEHDVFDEVEVCQHHDGCFELGWCHDE
jgi:hypothetical protein